MGGRRQQTKGNIGETSVNRPAAADAVSALLLTCADRVPRPYPMADVPNQSWPRPGAKRETIRDAAAAATLTPNEKISKKQTKEKKRVLRFATAKTARNARHVVYFLANNARKRSNNGRQGHTEARFHLDQEETKKKSKRKKARKQKSRQATYSSTFRTGVFRGALFLASSFSKGGKRKGVHRRCKAMQL